jgi:hypothetical protein
MQAAVGERRREPPPAGQPSPPGEDDLDGLDVLTRDHDHFDRLVKELAAPPGAPTSVAGVGPRRRADLARAIATELQRHEAAEQQHLWPLVREVLPDGDDRAEQARRDEDDAAELVADLVTAEPGDGRFDELVHQLSEALRRHVAFEDDVFLRLRDVVPEARRVELGRRIAEAESPPGR